jgi:hypothetical protein
MSIKYTSDPIGNRTRCNSVSQTTVPPSTSTLAVEEGNTSEGTWNVCSGNPSGLSDHLIFLDRLAAHIEIVKLTQNR